MDLDLVLAVQLVQEICDSCLQHLVAATGGGERFVFILHSHGHGQGFFFFP